MIAGGGFAMMAWGLAKSRIGLNGLIDAGPASRRVCMGAEPWDLGLSREYYRIIDNATRRMSAYNAAYKLGMVSDTFTVRL